jgi:hypothetical protein
VAAEGVEPVPVGPAGAVTGADCEPWDGAGAGAAGVVGAGGAGGEGAGGVGAGGGGGGVLPLSLPKFCVQMSWPLALAATPTPVEV